MSKTRYRIFITVTPGLEPLLEQELADLDLKGKDTTDRGGIEVTGDITTLWRITCCSRLAESVRVRLGHPRSVTTFDELEQYVSRLPWAAFIPRQQGLPDIKVSCRRSRLYHSGAVKQRIASILTKLLACEASIDGSGLPTIYARLDHDRAQFSIDASGERLHRRGYRKLVGRAPLRETLAAACLYAAGYRGQQDLWDPFCGAGTIVLEAAAMATGRAAGAQRSFAFQSWPIHDAEAFDAFVAGLPRPGRLSSTIMGSDRSRRVLIAAQANTSAASLAGEVSWTRGSFEQVTRQVADGTTIVTNPPHGRRYRGDKELIRTFRSFGEMLGQRTGLDPVYVLTGHPGFARSTGLAWQRVLRFRQGGLPVSLLRLIR